MVPLSRRSGLQFEPLTAALWPDLEALFGEDQACARCWSMWFRLMRSEFARQDGEQKKGGLRALVEDGQTPGLLAYMGSEPIAWCSVAPREAFSALARSRILKPVDNEPVWSIVCLYVAPPARRRGVATALLEATLEYAGQQGAKIVEGYPVEPDKAYTQGVDAATALASAFRRVGFVEVLRRSRTRPIMRRVVG